MSFLNDVWADLKEKRLWPLAVGLLAALVAVPLLLADPAEEESAPPAPPAPAAPLGGASLGGTKPVVSLETGYSRGFRKRVARLSRKNPFIPQALPKAPRGESLTPVEGGGSSDAGTPGAGTDTALPGSTTTPTEGREREVVYFEYVARVSFGEVGETKSRTLRRLDTLPSATNPVTVFMGVLTDGKTAVFLVSGSATARGDGECKPDFSNCTFVHMKKDDVEFFEVQDGDSVTTYELELQNIRVRTLKKAEESSARSSRKSARRAGDKAEKRAERKTRKKNRKRAQGFLSAFDRLGF